MAKDQVQDKAALEKAAAEKAAAEAAARAASSSSSPATTPSAHPPAPPGSMAHVNGEDGPVAISYPRKGKKGTAERAQTEQMRAIWADSKAAMCVDPKCFYPLRARLDPNTGEQLREQTAQGEMLVGECSWDPRHAGGKQLYKAPKRNFLPEDTAQTDGDEDADE